MIITFDNFLELSKDKQDEILNNYDLLKELVKQNISEHRYKHSLSVADVSMMLAKLYNIDQNKAYLAGLLHDVCKFPDSDTSGLLEKYLEKYEPSKLNGIYGAYHSWVAYYYLKEKLNYQDEEVLNAIYNHTILDSNDTLSLILYIADKREPLRNIDDDVLELAKKDLNKAYNKLKELVKRYVKDKNERFIDNRI